jgi:hypothetical protein
MDLICNCFFDYSFLVQHPANWDDQHLLECAMASDFSVAWQFSQREQLLFFKLRIKHHTLIQLGVSLPSFDTGAQNGVLCGSSQEI